MKSTTSGVIYNLILVTEVNQYYVQVHCRHGTTIAVIELFVGNESYSLYVRRSGQIHRVKYQNLIELK